MVQTVTGNLVEVEVEVIIKMIGSQYINNKRAIKQIFE
jgi:hypothetical protein